MIRYFSMAAAAAMLATTAAQAASVDTGDTYTVRIATGDLDLASSAGQATLNGRISRAADLACGRSPVVPLSQAYSVEACRAYLMRAAHARVEVALRSGDTRIAGTR